MTEAISKQSIETVAWLLLNAYSKHGKKNTLKMELLIKREINLKGRKFSACYSAEKMRNTFRTKH